MVASRSGTLPSAAWSVRGRRASCRSPLSTELADTEGGRGGVEQPVVGRTGGDELGCSGHGFAAQGTLGVTDPGEDGAA